MKASLFSPLCVLSLTLLLSVSVPRGFADPRQDIPSPPVPMGSVQYLDARNGFRDVQFGSTLSECPGMTLAKDEGDLKYYRRAGDDLSLGGTPLQMLNYGFYKGRLMLVLLATSGAAHSSAVLRVLEQAYGPGRHPNQFLPTYRWWGTRVNLRYIENVITHDAMIAFDDRALRAQQEADEKSAATKSASGL